jgi:hypothetical protein
MDWSRMREMIQVLRVITALCGGHRRGEQGYFLEQ